MINVGIMTAGKIHICFHSTFTADDGASVTGNQTFSFTDGKIGHVGKLHDTLHLSPASDDAIFEITDVTIGVNFHWQRNENQSFQGSVRLVATDRGITVINVIKAERYLRSVISSEMRSTSSAELLKAHAIISRSWLLAQLDRHNTRSDDAICTVTEHDGIMDVTRWYDHTDHDLFDVCADDHCQRYQGINKADTPAVDKAISDTAGMVLMYGNQLCDARFSKCCGGVLEQFENCWQHEFHPYLLSKRDCDATDNCPDLRREADARRWIMSSPESFCNTADAKVLSQVLNSYDMETPDFYRWQVTYSQDELSSIIRERSGMDFGNILELRPIERGRSGRIIRLSIIGTKLKATVGKELEIRKWLSHSHLYSSAFVIKATDADSDGVPRTFTLHGAGWGHGVGLCQIGAAMMAEQNYTYDRILNHYYPGSEIKKLY